MEVNSNTCATYIRVRRMAYVPLEAEYCRFVCNGSEEMCQHEGENSFKPIGRTQQPFRIGGLAMVVFSHEK